VKRLLVLVATFLIAIQLSAQNRELAFGVQVGFFPGLFENQTMNDYQGLIFPAGTEFKFDMHYSAISIRAFFDFTDGLFSFGYRTAVSKMTVTTTASGSSLSSDEDVSLSCIEFRGLWRHPFDLGFAKISPLVGVELAFLIDDTMSGVSLGKNSTDLSVLGGVELELRLSPHIVLRPGLTAAYVVTNRRDSSYYSGVSYVSSNGWFLEAFMGIAFPWRPAGTKEVPETEWL